jgi:hypothetical protein
MHDSANSYHKEGHKINEPTVSNNKTISNFISYETVKGLISVIKDIYNSTVKQDVTETNSVQLDKWMTFLINLDWWLTQSLRILK